MCIISAVIVSSRPVNRAPSVIIAIGMLKYLVVLNIHRRYAPVKSPVSSRRAPGIPKNVSGRFSVISLIIVVAWCHKA